MRQTVMKSMVVGGAIIVSMYFAATSSSDARELRVNASLSNPCLGVPEANVDRDVDFARILVTDSAYDGLRAHVGATMWTSDSVSSTTDSTVCAHLDSLVSIWLGTPSADSLDVERVSWWINSTAVRMNPGKYLVKPQIVVDDWQFNFVVDSVSGDVRFVRTPW